MIIQYIDSSKALGLVREFADKSATSFHFYFSVSEENTVNTFIASGNYPFDSIKIEQDSESNEVLAVTVIKEMSKHYLAIKYFQEIYEKLD